MQSIMNVLKKSYTFSEILKGNNEVVNYDSTLSNLLDIVNELSRDSNSPAEIALINHDSLVKYFAAVRAANLASTDISLADYAKELMVM